MVKRLKKHFLLCLPRFSPITKSQFLTTITIFSKNSSWWQRYLMWLSHIFWIKSQMVCYLLMTLVPLILNFALRGFDLHLGCCIFHSLIWSNKPTDYAGITQTQGQSEMNPTYHGNSPIWVSLIPKVFYHQLCMWLFKEFTSVIIE